MSKKPVVAPPVLVLPKSSVPVKIVKKDGNGSLITEAVQVKDKTDAVSGTTGATQQLVNLSVQQSDSNGNTGNTQKLDFLSVDEPRNEDSVNVGDGSSNDASVMEVAANEDVLSEVQNKTANDKVGDAIDAKKKLDMRKLEERSIQQARRNSMGELVRSAEPYNYWQDFNKQPFGYMTRVIGVQFNSRWNPTSAQVEQLIKKDLGFEGKEHEKVVAVGRNGKRITLTAKTKEIKREMYEILTTKFSQKYRCISFEEPETFVMMNNVPYDMPDEVVANMLTNYGDITEPMVHMKCDLGYPNLQRKVLMKLRYDLPSYLRIEGYTTQPRYDGQPSTCRLCGSRDHMAIGCELNTGFKYNAEASKGKKSGMDENMDKNDDKVVGGIDTEKIMTAVKENIGLFGDQTGSSLNEPALMNVIDQQIKRFRNKDRRDVRNPGPQHSEKHREKRSHDDEKNKGSAFIMVDGNRKRRRAGGKVKFVNKTSDKGHYSGANAKDTGSVRNKAVHDYFDGDMDTSNRFSALQDELELSSSSSDEEHRKYVRDQNSIYM